MVLQCPEPHGAGSVENEPMRSSGKQTVTTTCAKREQIESQNESCSPTKAWQRLGNGGWLPQRPLPFMETNWPGIDTPPVLQSRKTSTGWAALGSPQLYPTCCTGRVSEIWITLNFSGGRAARHHPDASFLSLATGWVYHER